MKQPTIWKMGLVLAILFLTNALMASPVGTWKTIDDKTGKEKSYVKIFKYKTKSGEERLGGKIVKLINPKEPDPKCTACPGSKKNKPIVGLTFMWGLKKVDDGWDKGKIMDPANGKTYNCYIHLEGANKLKVRGYFGFRLAGRTQTWYRLK